METKRKRQPPKPITIADLDGRRWLHYREAGAILGISGEAARMLVRRGVLPYAQLGRRIYIDRQELERYLESRKSKPRP